MDWAAMELGAEMVLDSTAAQGSGLEAEMLLDTAAPIPVPGAQPCVLGTKDFAMELDMPGSSGTFGTNSCGCSVGSSGIFDNAWVQHGHVLDHCLSSLVSLATVEAKLGGALVRRVRSIVHTVYTSIRERRHMEQILATALLVQPLTFSVEVVFLKLLYAAHIIRELAPAGRLLQFIEFVAGEAGVTQHLHNLGCTVYGFDLRIDPGHDINNGPGFRLHLLA